MRRSPFIFLGITSCAAAAVPVAPAAAPAKFNVQPILRAYYDVASSRGSPATDNYTEGLSYFRFGARGGYGPDLTYMLQFEGRDFVRDRGNLALRYCVLQWQATKSATLELGQTDEPFGLESYTQVRNLTFLERGLPFAFTPFYHTGASWRQRMGAFSWHAGVFGDTLGAGPNDDGRGGSLRLTYDPKIAGFSAYHVGFSVARREYATHGVRFSSRSESQLFPLRLADTRLITQVDHTTTVVAEGLFTTFGVTVFGEATSCRVERTGGLPDLDFSGAYVAVSRYLAGELKNYDAAHGQLREVTPRGRLGAVELALRQSVLDLDDKTIHGGRQSGTTLGLNWYYGRQIRVALNYSLIRVENGPVVERPRLLQTRLQFDY